MANFSDFINKYPYTDFHELNLDWLITEFKKLLDSYQGIIDWIENDAANFNILQTRISVLEGETFELSSRIAAEHSYIDFKAAQLDTQIANQYTRITTEYTGLYDSIMTQFQSQIYGLQILIGQVKYELTTDINNSQQATMDWVRNELQVFLDNLPDYEQLIIYNPVIGEYTNVQTAINDLYSYYNYYALTAQEYDDLQLTADEYDSYHITAHEYDYQGKQYLGSSSQWFMISPFTGERTPIPEVINALFDLHRTALTAQEYDALELTASAYDALDLTAYDYDMYGIH